MMGCVFPVSCKWGICAPTGGERLPAGNQVRCLCGPIQLQSVAISGETSKPDEATGKRMAHQSPEWNGGWLAGMGFGVLLCISIHQDHDAFQRMQPLLLTAGVVTLVFGILKTKKAFR